MNRAIVWEVYGEMVQLRLRDTQQRDSARLACAIRGVATRRKMKFAEIEEALDQALAYRVSTK